LQIAHEGLLDAVDLRELHVDSLSRPLKVLCAFRKILAALDTSGSYGKCALEKKKRKEKNKLSVTVAND
jgi:hypothetical protein